MNKNKVEMKYELTPLKRTNKGGFNHLTNTVISKRVIPVFNTGCWNEEMICFLLAVCRHVSPFRFSRKVMKLLTGRDRNSGESHTLKWNRQVLIRASDDATEPTNDFSVRHDFEGSSQK